MPNWRDTLNARQNGDVAGFIGADEPVEDFVARHASDLAGLTQIGNPKTGSRGVAGGNGKAHGAGGRG